MGDEIGAEVHVGEQQIVEAVGFPRGFSRAWLVRVACAGHL
jgi:hypothetical protein